MKNKNNQSLFEIEEEVIVFDSDSWAKTGDIGKNEQFYLPAKIINIRKSLNNQWLADVEFKDGRKSFGHFQSCITSKT